MFMLSSLGRGAFVAASLTLFSSAHAGYARTQVAGLAVRDIASIPPAAWADDDPADALYRSAREAINDRDYRKAARLFGEITSKYPRSAYASDALYWRAFALYLIGGEDDLREALKSLESEHTSFPKAKTIADADELMVRIRGALAKRGDANEAEAVTKIATREADCRGDGDKRDDMRAEAMNVLLQMDAQGALPIIKQVLQKRDACSASLRKKAVFVLSQKQSSETETLLVDVARNDPSAAVREDAVFWLGQVHSDKAAALLEDFAMNSKDMRIREKAIFALGEQNASRGASLLKRVAESADSPGRLREQAIFQLGQRGSSENANYLRELFPKVGSDALKKNVLFSLSQMKGYGNDKWLLSVAQDKSNSDEVRKHALWTAGQAGVSGSEMVSLYDRLSDRALREQLIWVLSDSPDRAASDKLVDIALHDKDVDMRKKAIFWLGQKNDPRIKQILLDILK